MHSPKKKKTSLAKKHQTEHVQSDTTRYVLSGAEGDSGRRG
ncbi:unnamed protein product [Staurois parvus]|uniref:Uncharacterized protein n=1 Tax=Staurois parvus TaxID=386267 RepID=A0ABN9AH08_9NEOB|nr:unnamed protein product [Staurois parvus]